MRFDVNFGFICAVSSALLIGFGADTNAGSLSENLELGQQVFTLTQGDTVVKVAPESGANVFSIKVKGVEYLHQPEVPERLAGVRCGVPILYPMPNRVKDGKFTFEGETVQFLIARHRKWFIHGLVNRYSWKEPVRRVAKDHVSVTFVADFSEGTKLGNLFPFPHKLKLEIEVRESRVRWRYVVDNTSGKKPVPFGFALHPYLVYQGQRSETFVTIPATHLMEAEEQMPTGDLVPAIDLPYPLGEPFSLEGKKFDDVFWGMKASEPTLIDFRDVGRKLRIRTSEEFTHLVVWTPDRPFFGIESQTCSTDAHNLYALGKRKESHLQVCAPGESMTAWVEYEFSGR